MAVPLDGVGVLVPAERIGRVIGRGGMGLKKIREEAGVKVVVDSSEAPFSASARRVDFSGSVNAIATAFGILSDTAFRGQGDGFGVSAGSGEGDHLSPVVIVPSSAIGRVIGKGGESLKRIREQTGVHVAPEREDNTTRAVPERLITLTGPLERLPNALQHVLAAAADSAKRDQASFAPAGGMPGQPHLMAPGAYGGKGNTVMPPMPGMMAVGLPQFVTGVPGLPFTGLRLQTVAAGEIQVHVHMPDKLVGAIVGKAGARVKQTGSEAGCKIFMTSREACMDRRAVVIGTLVQVAKAEELLHAQLVEAAETHGVPFEDMTVTFFVPKDDASAVIGKQASTLKAIREQTSVKVHFWREEFCGHRPCCVTGTLENVMQAQQLIHEKLGSAAASPEGMPAPPGF